MKKTMFSCMFLAIALIVSPVILSAGNAASIDRVQVSVETHQIVIFGQNFGTVTPTVLLGSTSLTVTSYSDTLVVTSYSPSLAAGSYSLLLTPTQDNGHQADSKAGAFIVTIGAVGPTGAQGLVGPVGLQGPAGPAGPQGPAGQADPSLTAALCNLYLLVIQPQPSNLSCPTCSDGIKNGSETDVDCGGVCSQKCAAGKMCSANSDCQTGNCQGGYCSAACLTGSTKSCYSGSASLLGHGVCHAGIQTCGAGGVWGTCYGEVFPSAEVCNGMDDDCDGQIDEGSGLCPSGQICSGGACHQ